MQLTRRLSKPPFGSVVGCLFCAAAISLLVEEAVAQGRREIIAVTGRPAPDGNGTFSDFGRAALNDAGQTVFRGRLNPLSTTGGLDDDTGVFRSGDSELDQLVREGQAAPDGNGVFADFIPFPAQQVAPAFNNAGHAAFFGRLRDTAKGGDDNSGLFRADSSVVQIVREGQLTPELPPGSGAADKPRVAFVSPLGEEAFTDPVLNDNGLVGFRGRLEVPFSVGGHFVGDGGPLEELLRDGDLTPDGSGEVLVLGPPTLNNNGQLAAAINATSGRSVEVLGAPMLQIVQENQIVPGADGQFASFGPPSVNNNGQAAFFAGLKNTPGGFTDDSGIFRGAGSATMEVTEIAREGRHAPGGGQFGGFSTTSQPPPINAAGDVAFKADLTGTPRGSSDDQGIFRFGSVGSIAPGLNEIAGEGQSAPDGNGTFVFFDETQPVMNDLSQVAFTTSLANTSGVTGDDRGIFIGDGFEVVRVAREGQPLAGSTIGGLSFTEGALPNRGLRGNDRTGINNFAQVAFTAELSGGRKVVGLFTPELQWRGTASDGQWDSRTNFTLSTPPGRVHDVTIAPNTDTVVTGPSTDTTIKSLTVGGGSGNVELKLQPGVALAVTDGVTLASNGMLSGTGTLTSDLLVQGTIAPGASPGLLSVAGDVVWAGGSLFEWEINDFLGIQGADPGFDLFDITGSLSIDASSSNPIEIDIVSLTLQNTFGEAADFDDSRSFRFPFVRAAGGITGFGRDKFLIDAGRFSNPFTGTYSISQLGNELLLDFTPADESAPSPVIPEPSSFALMTLGGLSLLGYGCRRRRRRKHPTEQ